MSSCVLPGQENKDRLENDEMEIGMGIHGETGKEKRKVEGLNEIVGLMLVELI
jgi:dihydroxyacetone kinase